MWLVDTSVWINYFSGVITPETDRLHEALGREPVSLGDIILCEVLQGFRRQHDFERAKAALLAFPIYPLGASSWPCAAQNTTVLFGDKVSPSGKRLTA